MGQRTAAHVMKMPRTISCCVRCGLQHFGTSCGAPLQITCGRAVHGRRWRAPDPTLGVGGLQTSSSPTPGRARRALVLGRAAGLMSGRALPSPTPRSLPPPPCTPLAVPPPRPAGVVAGAGGWPSQGLGDRALRGRQGSQNTHPLRDRCYRAQNSLRLALQIHSRDL